jgi:hypothetical protein
VVVAAVAAGTSGRCQPEAERHSAAAQREHSATGAVVIGAVATGAVVTGAVATGAVVIGAVVTGAVAIGAVVTGAVVTGAVIIGAAIGGAMDFPMTNPFLSVDLVFRSTRILITGTIRTTITATALTHPGIILRTGTTTMIIPAVPLTGTATTAIKAMAIKAMAIKATVIKVTVIKVTVIKATVINLRLRSYSADWPERGTITARSMESWDQRPVVQFAPTKVRTAHSICANRNVIVDRSVG